MPHNPIQVPSTYQASSETGKNGGSSCVETAAVLDAKSHPLGVFLTAGRWPVASEGRMRQQQPMQRPWPTGNVVCCTGYLDSLASQGPCLGRRPRALGAVSSCLPLCYFINQYHWIVLIWKEPCLPCLVVISLARGSEFRSLGHRLRSVCAASALLLPVLGRSGALCHLSSFHPVCLTRSLLTPAARRVHDSDPPAP
jgi:hypothetical protein